MSYIKKTISINSTEQEFVQTFINEFTATDSRIVCETTDIDAQFEYVATVTATIRFNINNCCYIDMIRSNTNTAGIMLYTFRFIANDTTYATASLNFASGNNNISTVATRGLNFTVASNDNAIYITIGGYNKSVPSEANFAVLALNNGEFCAAAGSTTVSTIATGNFYCTDTENSGTCIKLVNRINYEIESGKIEIINNKILTDSTVSTKFSDINGLMDCSTIVPYNILTIDDKKYLAIDAHTLILIESGDD